MLEKLRRLFRVKSSPPPDIPGIYFEYFVHEQEDGKFGWMTRAYLPKPSEVSGVEDTKEKARLKAADTGKQMIGGVA